MLIAIAAVLLAAAAASAQISLEEVSGDVEVQPAGRKWESAEAGMNIAEGTSIKTGRNSEAVLRWERGHSVKVDELTELVIDEAYYSRRTGLEQTRIQFENGKMIAATNKFRNRDSEFEVRTPTARAGVRGTKFVVNVEDGKSSFLVLEGQLSIIAESVEIILDQNFQTTVEPGAAPSQPTTIPESTRQQYSREADSMSKGQEESGGTSSTSMEDSDTQIIYDNVVEGVIDERLQDEVVGETAYPYWGCCD